MWNPERIVIADVLTTASIILPHISATYTIRRLVALVVNVRARLTTALEAYAHV